MTDDEDRMERAERIRRMREGRRTDSADDDNRDSGGDGVADGPEPDDMEGTAGEPDPSEWFEESSEDTAADTQARETGDMTGNDSTVGETAESADETSADSSDSQADDVEQDTADTSSAGTDDDATAAASSAAAAAAAFESDDGGLDEGGDADSSEGTTGVDVSDSPTADEDTAENSQPAEIKGPAATQPETNERREEEIRVLEFRLGDEQYCLNIQHVEEIVKEETVTRVPNTPEHVRGVVDLRGQITTILDPKVSLEIDETDGEQLIVVFDEGTLEEQGHVGWVVDEVRQVMPITESEVKDSPLDQKAVNGVIERDDEFVIWAEPEVALLDEERST